MMGLSGAPTAYHFSSSILLTRKKGNAKWAREALAVESKRAIPDGPERPWQPTYILKNGLKKLSD